MTTRPHDVFGSATRHPLGSPSSFLVRAATLIAALLIVTTGCYASEFRTGDSSADASVDIGAADAGAEDAGRDADGDSGSDSGRRDAGSRPFCESGADARLSAGARDCEVAVDCFALAHQIDCCGSVHWLGVRRDRWGEFDRQEAICRSAYPECSCVPRRPEMDDGSVYVGGHEVRAGCEAGVCMSTVAGGW